MIASLIPNSLFTDGLKTGFKLLNGQDEASLLFLLCSSKRKESTVHFIIHGGRHLIRMQEIQISMQEIQNAVKFAEA